MTYRAFISLAFAAMLVLTSQAMAVARGTSDATGQMVICVGAGTMVVYTDADGAPTGAPHLCPDCALQVSLIPTSPYGAVPTASTKAVLPKALAALCIPSRDRMAPPSRAPPVRV